VTRFLTTRVTGNRVEGPPATGPISSAFGWRDIPEHAEGHSGVDIAVPTGTPVLAPAAGVVLNVAYDRDGSALAGYFGNAVILQHEDAVTLYGHLSAVLVAPDDRVEVGTLLGRSGNTGVSTGPHLHWGMAPLSNPYLGRAGGLLDPLDYAGQGTTTATTTTGLAAAADRAGGAVTWAREHPAQAIGAAVLAAAVLLL